MSYPKTLDEISSQELIDELVRRDDILNKGKCPYCAHELVEDEDIEHRCICRFGDKLKRYHPKGILNQLKHRS